MNTQYRNNLKAVLEASKTYCDESIDSLRWELGTYDLSVETINGTTMLLPTPANTIQATMVRVDGASEVSENLIVLVDVVETTINDITYSVSNGVITRNGTPTSNFNNDFALSNSITLKANTSYTFANMTGDAKYSIILSNSSNVNIGQISSNATTAIITPAEDVIVTKIRIWSTTNLTDTNYQFKLMLVKGTTAPTDFKVGYTGIHNFEWNGIKVEGANLFNLNGATTSGNISYNKDTCEITTTTSSYSNQLLFSLLLPKGTYTLMRNISGNKNSILYSGETNVAQIGYALKKQTFTLRQDTTITSFRTSLNGTQKFVIVRGNVAYDEKYFVPYIAPTTKTIDLSTILYNGSPLFEGNSLKGVNDVKDSITPYKATKKLGYVNLGTLDYTKFDVTQGTLFRTTLSTMKYDNTTNLVCAKYETVLSTNRANMTISKAQTGSAQIDIIDNSYATAEAFKTAMSGVYLVYELATPIEADINLSQLVKFEAHSNGSITLVNTNNQDTTSTFKYLKEVAK